MLFDEMFVIHVDDPSSAMLVIPSSQSVVILRWMYVVSSSTFPALVIVLGVRPSPNWISCTVPPEPPPNLMTDGDGSVEYVVRVPEQAKGLAIWFQTVQQNLKTGVVATRIE